MTDLTSNIQASVASLPLSSDRKKMSLFYSTHSNPIYTTNELKQAVYKSTCGVLPIRRSTSIPELNVHLRGRTLMSSNDMRVAANTPISPNAALVIDVDSTTTASYFPPPPVQSPVELDRLLLQKRRQPLPAILPVTGTTHTATLLHRQPPVKPVIYIPPVKRKRLKILEIDVGAENDEAQIATDRSALEEQQDAVSTVAKMLNEAKALRADNSKRTTPATPLNLSRTSRKSVKASSTTPTHALYGATKTDDPTLTAVENLISSIKSKELQEAQRQSDNRILEIIDRVLGRKVELKYDDDLTEEQQQKEIPKESLMSGITLSEAPSPVLESGGPDVSRADYAATFEEKFRNEDIDQELADVDEESSVETEAPELSIDIEHDALYKHYLIGITNEELLHIRGNKIPFLVKQEFMKETKSPRETTLKTSTSERGIHHFCIQMMDSSLPFSLQTITQLYHKRARFRHHLPKSNIYYKHGNLPKYSLTNDSKTDDQFEQEHDAPRHSAISHTTQRSIPSIPYNSLPTTSEENELDTWQKRADILFKVPEIEGTSVVQLGENARLWTPAPPKMYFHPSKVKQKLFPKYKTSISIMKIANDDDAKHDDELDETIDTNWSEKDDVDELVMRNERLLSRKYKSLEILPSQITSLMNNLNEPLNQIVDHVHLSRSRSCPDISVLHTETIKFETDYLFTLAETKHQMINMAESLAKATAPIVKPIGTPTQAAMMSDQIDEPITHSSFVDFSVPGISSSSQIDTSSSPVDETSKEVKNNNQEFKYFRKNQRSFLYEQAIAAGRPYITSAKLRSQRQKKKEVKYWKRIDDIVKLATDSGKIPERRYSINETRTIVRKHKKRQSSLDRQKQQFDQIKRTYNYETTRIKSGGKRQLTEFQWTRDIWYQWLDEYIAELDKREQDRQVKEDEQIITDSEPVYQYDVNDDDDDETETKKKRLQVISEPIVNITISIDDEDSEQEKVIIENELKRLNILIEQNLRDVYSLTRRGALYRKLGLFKDALNDLNLALYIEPLFMDAYWQKSLILMIFKHYDDALDCLNHVIKLNKTHSGAYKLRGDIYLIKNDLSLAIANYSQAIKYNPNDHESFYQRAQTYERRNDLLLAMDDYVQVTRLNPDNIEAWYKHAMHYYRTGDYEYAITDFNELLKRNKEHVDARLYRGLSYLNKEYYQQALNDFSSTIHYDPNNWQAFYYRGALLRLCKPDQALKDLSISLLLNDEYDNLNAYLHRALIYYEKSQFNEAVNDYESIVQLDREYAPAYCNLGIIYMKMNNKANNLYYQKAIKLFTKAIIYDPTYIRAYFCRANVYYLLNDLKNAYYDYTKIYHMYPDQNASIVLRGKILIDMGELELASFCVEVAAKLQSNANENADYEKSNNRASMNMNATNAQQQAIVQTFLEEYDYALKLMERECLIHPTSANYNLIGSLYIKAKKFEHAKQAYEKTIQICINDTSLTSDLYQAYIELSRCQMQLKQYQDAIENLTQLIKLKPDNAIAYLQRGIAKMRLCTKMKPNELANIPSSKRGLLDINRALVLEPNNFEAYLARAAWYARCQRYSKAVLNCNEAILISPNLVRAYLYRGCLKYELRLYDHAISDLTQATKLDPSCSHAYYNRALCHIKKRQYLQAFKDFAIVLCLVEKTSNTNDDTLKERKQKYSHTQQLEFETYVNRGLLHYEQRDYLNALQDFHLALTITSNDAIRYTVALCHHKLGEFNESIQYFNEILSQNIHHHDTLIAKGNVYMDMGQQLTAKQIYEQVLYENPLHELARLNLAYCLQLSGKYQRAWTQFTTILQMNMKNVKALEGRSLVCLQMSHPSEALYDLNRALNIQTSAQSYTNRGVIQQYLGDNVSAMIDYKSSMLCDPKYALAYYNAANILFFHGQFQEALKYYDTVIELNPYDEAALTNRGITKAILKEYQSARQDFERALNLSSTSAHIHIDFGMLLLTMNENELAEKHFTEALNIRSCDPLVYKLRADAYAAQGQREKALNDYRTCVELTDIIQLVRKHGLIKQSKSKLIR